MLATQTPESGSETRDVKKWIKDNIAQTLKVLQKRYITSDTAVTSEDQEANLLCCALEAIFIHGIRSKFIRSDGGHVRKGGSQRTLPQPVFWSLLKTVTHRDVVQELERLSFINSDTGRCRAWVRLALNEGLLECYLTSLLREDSKLSSFYQPGALLLDPEDREVLLTLLQGLASLTFQLSYKSAVLNEWTNTPLVLAGLCPPTPADEHHLLPNRKGSWDTVSRSSGGSGSLDWAPEALQRELRNEQIEDCETNTPLTSSNHSLDTSGSPQLSSSLSSDSHEHRSHEMERWSCDAEINHNTPQKITATEESSHSNQEDVVRFIPAPDNLIDSNSVDENTHMPDASRAAKQDTHASGEHVTEESEACKEERSAEVSQKEVTAIESETLVKTTRIKVKHSITKTPETEQKMENRDSSLDPTAVSALTEIVETTSDLEDPDSPLPETSTAPESVEQSQHASCRRSTSIISRKTSTDSLYSSCKSTSWLSPDDFYKPEETSFEDYAIIDVTQVNGQVTPTSEPETFQPPPSVIHRRQNGLNLFRGLLKLGQLERRNAVGMWWDYYCELSPFELRLYMNAEERICYENLSLVRCEDVRLSSGNEGRFRLTFLGKKIYLRAPSSGEAEDWVDRILEAVNKLRPTRRDEHWEVLHTSSEQEVPSPTPSSPERTIPELPDPPQLDWTRHTDPEPDAIKEAVVYQNLEEKGWRTLVLSLSLETLRGYHVQEDAKTPLFSHPIGNIRDVVPDVSLGSPAFFKVLTVRDTLTLRAESGEEARRWRSLIRGALDSYLETEDDGPDQGVSSPACKHGGSVHKLVQHRLKGDGSLLSHLTVVPNERGLDAQNYKCAGCPRQIGLSLGRARLCEFSGQHFCESCHQGDATIIPSRLLHNWDLTTREVSKQAFKLLTQIEHEPLMNIDALNPDLFEHSDIMAKVKNLRQRLRFLGDYILICRSGIGKQIQPRLQQRTYLLDNSDVYSVLDLQQIADGHYESYMQSLIQFGSKHVHNCDLCTQRGFICQICNSDSIIFPFQFDSTTRCNVCKTVFHSSCKANAPVCPRCVRIQKYLERNSDD